jgi:hypothetical protein
MGIYDRARSPVSPSSPTQDTLLSNHKWDQFVLAHWGTAIIFGSFHPVSYPAAAAAARGNQATGRARQEPAADPQGFTTTLGAQPHTSIFALQHPPPRAHLRVAPTDTAPRTSTQYLKSGWCSSFPQPRSPFPTTAHHPESNNPDPTECPTPATPTSPSSTPGSQKTSKSAKSIISTTPTT